MARYFDGTTYYSRAGAIVGGAGYGWTMACWCRTSDTTNRNICMSVGRSDTDLYGFGVFGIFNDLGVGLVRFLQIYQSASYYTVDANRATIPGQWNHVAAISYTSGQRGDVAVNGVLGSTVQSSNTGSGSYPNQSSVGCLLRTSDQNNFVGDLAHAAFWSVSLTSAEVQALASGLSPLSVRPESLAAYYPIPLGKGLAGIELTRQIDMTVHGTAYASSGPAVYGELDQWQEPSWLLPQIARGPAPGVLLRKQPPIGMGIY